MRRFSLSKFVSLILWIGLATIVYLKFFRSNVVPDRNEAEPQAEDLDIDIIQPDKNHFNLETHFEVCATKSNSYDDKNSAKKKAKDFLSDRWLLKRTSNCEEYFSKFSSIFFDHIGVEDDVQRPLAFAHQVHKEIGILEMFLALFYRPKDLHCIHLDEKVKGTTRKAVENLVKCYHEKFPGHPDSLFISKETIPVYWGHMSVLDADLICLRELRQRNSEWHHAATLAGTELPIVSYKDYQEILLRIPRGESLYFSRPYPPSLLQRVKETHHLYWVGPGPQHLMIQSIGNGNKKPPPPYKLQLFKGMKNIIIHRDLTDFVLDDPVAIKFKEWLEDSCCPEEAFYSTLGRLKYEVVNGQQRLIQDLSTGKLRGGVCPRFTIWWSKSKCQGKNIRGICNFALEDLPTVHSSSCLIANKFSLDVDATAVVCHVSHLLKLTQREKSRK